MNLENFDCQKGQKQWKMRLSTGRCTLTRVAAWPGNRENRENREMSGNFFVERECFKIFNKKRFQFVLNVLHKVIYLYIILGISKFRPYFVISVYQEKLHFRIFDKKYFKTLKTYCINCYSLETIFLMTGNYFRRWKRPPWLTDVQAHFVR